MRRPVAPGIVFITLGAAFKAPELPRRLAWGSVVLGLALSLASYSAPALAQAPFVITSPPAGSILSRGQAVTVLWTGGDPSWSVDVYLIEVTPGFPFAVVATVAGSIPNSGIVNWTFPSSLPFGGPCGHTYQFYVQEVRQITWTYGPHFTVVCEIVTNPAAIPTLSQWMLLLLGVILAVTGVVATKLR